MTLDHNTLLNLVGLPTPQQEREVAAKLAECNERLLAAKFPKTYSPVILYDLKGHTAGYAIGSHTIRLNLDILNDPRHHNDMINQTLPHEFAHIVVAKMWPGAQAHGLEWKMVCQVLGIEARRCHSYDTKPARQRKRADRPHIYGCNCRDVIRLTDIRHRRIIEQNKQYKCTNCNTILTYHYTER